MKADLDYRPRGADNDVSDELPVFCPECAEREFGPKS
jgi:hypothetical protein